MGRVNTASKEKLSVIQQEIVIGTLLGDGRLESRSKNGSARLCIHHAESQYDFLMWKYDIFQNVVTREPWQVTWKGSTTGNTYQAWFFHTKTLEDLNVYHQMFYPAGKKVIPINIGDFLTPRALATWFMDDGCATGPYIILNTQCFSIAEQAILQKWFQERWNIKTTLQKDRLTYRLWMNAVNTERFRDIISPYIVPSMQYKITPRND